MQTIDIKILDELKNYIPPMNPEEYQHLEMSIRSEGCKEALLLWENPRERAYTSPILIDGHHRYEICTRLGIPFKTKITSEFDNLEEVKAWMMQNQFTRRNLNDLQRGFLIGREYNAIRKDRFHNLQTGIQKLIDPAESVVARRTAQYLGEKYKISESSIKRYAVLAEKLEYIRQHNTNLWAELLKKNIKPDVISEIAKLDYLEEIDYRLS